MKRRLRNAIDNALLMLKLVAIFLFTAEVVMVSGVLALLIRYLARMLY